MADNNKKELSQKEINALKKVENAVKPNIKEEDKVKITNLANLAKEAKGDLKGSTKRLQEDAKAKINKAKENNRQNITKEPQTQKSSNSTIIQLIELKMISKISQKSLKLKKVVIVQSYS